jgi:hypothetical protein
VIAAVKSATPKEEILRLAKVIGEELYAATANYEIFALSSRDAALIERVNVGGIHDGFNVVSEALQLAVISTLCRHLGQEERHCSVGGNHQEASQAP